MLDTVPKLTKLIIGVSKQKQLKSFKIAEIDIMIYDFCFSDDKVAQKIGKLSGITE